MDEDTTEFVKQVQNGIEHDEMEFICEAYHLMRDVLKMEPQEMSDTFDKWNEGELKSTLFKVTRDILKFKDDEGFVLERIFDEKDASDVIPFGATGSMINMLCASLKMERTRMSSSFKLGTHAIKKTEFLEDLRKALYVSRIISHVVAFKFMFVHHDDLEFSTIALTWLDSAICR